MPIAIRRHGSGPSIFDLGLVVFFADQFEWGQPPPRLVNFLQIFQFFVLSGKKCLQIGSKNTEVKARSAPYLLPVRSMLRSMPISS